MNNCKKDLLRLLSYQIETSLFPRSQRSTAERMGVDKVSTAGVIMGKERHRQTANGELGGVVVVVVVMVVVAAAAAE